MRGSVLGNVRTVGSILEDKPVVPGVTQDRTSLENESGKRSSNEPTLGSVIKRKSGSKASAGNLSASAKTGQRMSHAENLSEVEQEINLRKRNSEGSRGAQSRNTSSKINLSNKPSANMPSFTSVDGSGRFVKKPPSGRIGARRRSSAKVDGNTAIIKTDLRSKHSLVSKQPTGIPPRDDPDVFTAEPTGHDDTPKARIMEYESQLSSSNLKKADASFFKKTSSKKINTLKSTEHIGRDGQPIRQNKDMLGDRQSSTKMPGERQQTGLQIEGSPQTPKYVPGWDAGLSPGRSTGPGSFQTENQTPMAKFRNDQLA